MGQQMQRCTGNALIVCLSSWNFNNHDQEFEVENRLASVHAEERTLLSADTERSVLRPY
jgi:hypothetical protein